MKLPSVRSSFGFTFVELMVTVTILSIITAIAYPSYRENVRRAHRSDARALLLENAQYMERFFAENNSYLQSPAGVQPVLPNLISPRGASDAKKNYNLSFRAIPARTQMTYTIQAVPVNNMLGDQCATLTLNQLGQRGAVDGISANVTPETCWTK